MRTYFELTKHLCLREIRVRYKQSFLGFFWVILNPFFQMLIMSFVFSQFIKLPTGAAGESVPYALYVYIGLIPWVFFVNSINSGLDALVDGASLIKKIYFPREILVIATVGAKLFDVSLSFLILLGMFWFFGFPISWYALLAIPIFLVQILFVFGFSLLLSYLNLLYRDIQYLMSLVINLWFYLTPIVYATELFPENYRWIFKLNPMSVFINAYRQVLLGQSPPKWESLAIGVIMSVAIFAFAFWLFKKEEGTFADIA